MNGAEFFLDNSCNGMALLTVIGLLLIVNYTG